MTLLSRLGWLGIAKETTQGTFVAPTFYIPVTKPDAEIVYEQIKDQSYRASDSMLMGVYQGVGSSTISFDFLGYADAVGFPLRVIGPDTVTPGVATTLAAGSSVSATSISTAASIPSGSTIMIDTGVNVEYAVTGAPTGSGPYTIPIATPAAGLAKAHSSGVAVASQTTHTFKQSATSAKPSWSLVDYNSYETWGYAGAAFSDVQFKIDPKGGVTVDCKMTSWIGSTQTGLAAPTFSSGPPFLGWMWTMSSGGSSSTRGLSYDITLKRAVEAMHTSTGAQQPREVFSGVLEVDASYKAIYESDADYNLYLLAQQSNPAAATLTQPLANGGQTLTLTTSQPAWTKGKINQDGSYVAADFSLSGVYNATDSGSVQAVLKNYVTTAY